MKLKFNYFRIVVTICLLLYSVLVATLALSFEIPLIFIAMVLVFNAVMLYLIGSYLLRAIIFPYANYFIKKRMDSMLNEKFAKEFHKLLKQILGHIKVMAKIFEKEKEQHTEL